LEVERLLLPAVPQLLETWTGSFGFTVMSNSDKLELVENSILSFQGTTMCQKVLNVACSSAQDHSAAMMSNLERVGWAENIVLSSVKNTMSVKVVNNGSDGSEVLNMDTDGQGSTSVAMKFMEQLEPVLLEIQNNSSEEVAMKTVSNWSLSY
jgi:hypothetical protein